MKKIAAFLLLYMIFMCVFSQETYYDCANSDLCKMYLEQDKELDARANRIETQIQKLMNRKHTLEERVLHTIPVVIHIIHLPNTPINTGENISAAQISNALQHLTASFRKQGVYSGGQFAVDAEIEFCLARRDINGNPSTGIDRIGNNLSIITSSSQDAALKSLTQSPNLYPSTHYLNIWIVKEICSGNNCNVAGYSTTPAFHGLNIDGIVCEASYFGTNAHTSKVAIHQVGHYLGLYHTFEATNGVCINGDCLADGDHICDTPPDNSLFTCNIINSCATDVNPQDPNNPFTTNVNDMNENYMDNSGLSCMNTFTANQKTRMKISLVNIRNNLLNTLACVPVPPCGVTAAFSVPATSVNVNTSIVFTNNSSAAINYVWEKDGVAFSTIANPSYLFSAAGAYEMCLTASDNTCSNKQCMIITAKSLIVTPITSMNQAITNLIGNDLQISNIAVNCNTALPNPAIANYNAGLTSLGLTQGLLLTSGIASYAIGPNNTGGKGACNNYPGDPQLNVIGGGTTHDACIVEFDIIPNCDTLKIKYMFGSEEYPEYANSSFNDIFAFFISGQGFGNNVNIASLPNSTTAVSINNVNNGTSNVGPCMNCIYYVNNSGGNDIQYDGRTTIIQSKIPVILGASYHLKIAIADKGDCILDSGVFLEADGITCSTPPWGNEPILPVSIPSFNALLTQLAPYRTVLSWDSYSPIPVTEYQIERKMEKELTFSYLGSITDMSNVSFRYVDTAFMNYQTTRVEYRLKMIDENGRYVYSNTCQVQIPLKETLFLASIYPKPAQEYLYVKFEYLKETSINEMGIKIFDEFGRMIEKPISILSENELSLQLTGLAKGIYILKITHNQGGGLFTRFVVE